MVAQAINKTTIPYPPFLACHQLWLQFQDFIQNRNIQFSAIDSVFIYGYMEDAGLLNHGEIPNSYHPMKINIDLKSTFLGLIAGAGILFTLGADKSSSDPGRYQISTGQSMAIIVDTSTGQAWGYYPANFSHSRNDDNFWTAKSQ